MKAYGNNGWMNWQPMVGDVNFLEGENGRRLAARKAENRMEWKESVKTKNASAAWMAATEQEKKGLLSPI